MYVPFIPRERHSITPELSNFLNPLPIIDGVIPDFFAILLEIITASSPSILSKIYIIASSS